MRPRLGLSADDAAPAGRQPDRAADVGAHVQRAVARRRGRGGAGAGAAGRLRQVPRVARQRVEARQPRRQHPVVRHRGLADDHRAGLAQPRRRRRIVRRRRQLGGGGAQRHRHAARGDVLLDRARHAVQRRQRRALAPAPLACARAAASAAVRIERVGGVQLRLPALRCAPARRAPPPPARRPRAGTARPASSRRARAVQPLRLRRTLTARTPTPCR